PSRRGMDIDLFDITGTPLDGKVPDQPTVEQTDLRRALQESIAKLRSRPLAGVVLISDGMDNTRREKELGEGDFPEFANLPFAIHTIGFQKDNAKDGIDLAVGKPM